jgi:HemY protein
MWRVIWFLIAVVVAAFICIYVLDQHGFVSLTLGKRIYEASLGIVLLGLLAALFVIYLVAQIVLLVVRLPFKGFALSRSRRKEKGSAAISKGLVAVASGDLNAAARHAQAAERLVGQEPLALLLSAQAAQLRGDRDAAKAAFARMARLPETRGLGLRGLFVEARRRGDAGGAHQHAVQAAQLDVFLPWAHEATLVAQCRARDWPAALATLERNQRLGAMDEHEMRHAKAALLTARALDLRQAEPREALKVALAALKIEPGLTPAVTTAAALLAGQGQQRKAERIIEAAWVQSPHPDLAEAYSGLRPEQPAAERLQRIAKLAALSPGHEESRIALARAALAARQYSQARAQLAPLMEVRPSARVYLLMAEIEEAENGMSGTAREMLARAAHAPRDPAWIAGGVISAQWAPVEPETGRIGAFTWGHPPELPGTIADRTTIATLAVASHPKVEATAKPVEIAKLAPPQAANVGDAPHPEEDIPKTDRGQSPPVPARAEQDPAPPMRAAETVAFPLSRAPDDPGADEPAGKGLWRRLTG